MGDGKEVVANQCLVPLRCYREKSPKKWGETRREECNGGLRRTRAIMALCSSFSTCKCVVYESLARVSSIGPERL